MVDFVYLHASSHNNLTPHGYPHRGTFGGMPLKRLVCWGGFPFLDITSVYGYPHMTPPMYNRYVPANVNKDQLDYEFRDMSIL